MKKVRIATFNVENLFARYKFKSKIDTAKAVVDGWNADGRKFTIHDDDSKRITASAIKAIKADVIALQEVENLDTLKRFRNRYLGGSKAYPHVISIDGNDPRQIDVAVLSKLPLVHVRSYQHLRASPRSYVFSRDCMEVDVQVTADTTVTLFVNHLLSMMKGRRESHARRRSQAKKVVDIVKQRFGNHPGNRSFIILGDMNDYPETDSEGQSALTPLLRWSEVVNVVERLPASEQWTHYYKRHKAYRQLDYLFLSRSLAAASPDKPEIERRGLPTRAERVKVKRFKGVGKNKPKASDHCPVVMELHI